MNFIYRTFAGYRSINVLISMRPLMTVIMLYAANLPVAALERCSTNNAMQAMSEASTFRTWGGVFKSYEKYKLCDEGATAEGYSVSVDYLLAHRWKDLGALVTLSKRYPDFERFVIKHVDETMSMDQDKLIKGNIETNCPANAKKLCDAIQQRFAALGF